MKVITLESGRGIALAALVLAVLALWFAPALLGPISIALGAYAFFRGTRLGCAAAAAGVLCMVIGGLLRGNILQGML